MNLLKNVFCLILLSSIIISCDNNETIEVVADVKIGDLKEGGVVFWINPTDKTKGLVCTMSDFVGSGDIQPDWGCFGQNLPNVTEAINGNPPFGEGAEIGDGENNTNNMLKDCPTSPIALGARTFGADWFLPSAKELNEIYVNKTVLEAVPGFSPLNSHTWSSTEYDNLYAWSYSETKMQVSYKDFRFVVRAIRAF